MQIVLIAILVVASYIVGCCSVSDFYETGAFKPQQKQYCNQTYKNDVSKYEACYNKNYKLTFKVEGY